jgi:hypothetical protein
MNGTRHPRLASHLAARHWLAKCRSPAVGLYVVHQWRCLGRSAASSGCLTIASTIEQERPVRDRSSIGGQLVRSSRRRPYPLTALRGFCAILCVIENRLRLGASGCTATLDSRNRPLTSYGRSARYWSISGCDSGQLAARSYRDESACNDAILDVRTSKTVSKLVVTY